MNVPRAPDNIVRPSRHFSPLNPDISPLASAPPPTSLLPHHLDPHMFSARPYQQGLAALMFGPGVLDYLSLQRV